MRHEAVDAVVDFFTADGGRAGHHDINQLLPADFGREGDFVGEGLTRFAGLNADEGVGHEGELDFVSWL